MAKQIKLTSQRLEELQEELKYLKTVREKEVAELIKEARSFGDLSENSEYDEAKNEQGKVFSRIAEVEAILANYVLIDEEAVSASAVALGRKVTVKNLEDGGEEIYTIVGSQEANLMEGKISEESPFGKALMGKEKGAEVVVEAPVGNLRYQIVEVKKN